MLVLALARGVPVVAEEATGAAVGAVLGEDLARCPSERGRRAAQVVAQRARDAGAGDPARLVASVRGWAPPRGRRDHPVTP